LIDVQAKCHELDGLWIRHILRVAFPDIFWSNRPFFMVDPLSPSPEIPISARMIRDQEESCIEMNKFLWAPLSAFGARDPTSAHATHLLLRMPRAKTAVFLEQLRRWVVRVWTQHFVDATMFRQVWNQFCEDFFPDPVSSRIRPGLAAQGRRFFETVRIVRFNPRIMGRDPGRHRRSSDMQKGIWIGFEVEIPESGSPDPSKPVYTFEFDTSARRERVGEADCRISVRRAPGDQAVYLAAFTLMRWQIKRTRCYPQMLDRDYLTLPRSDKLPVRAEDAGDLTADINGEFWEAFAEADQDWLLRFMDLGAPTSRLELCALGATLFASLPRAFELRAFGEEPDPE
jgi:hypothetical protein